MLEVLPPQIRLLVLGNIGMLESRLVSRHFFVCTEEVVSSESSGSLRSGEAYEYE